MMHDESVLALAMTGDSELLASGSRDGKIKVWRLVSGRCICRFPRAHAGGVSDISFSREGTQLLSCGFDGVARIHGLRSGRALKEFRGHASFINSCTFTADGSQVVTGGSDGSVKVWDVRTTEEVYSIRPPQPNAVAEAAVQKVVLVPRRSGQLIVCNRSNALYVMTMTGQLLHTLSLPDEAREHTFVSCVVSPRGRWLLGFAEDKQVHCFDLASHTWSHSFPAHDAEPIGIAHHPHRNIVATMARENTLKLWRP